MDKKTLKSLINFEFEKSGSKEDFKEEVFRLIDLYELDNLRSSAPLPIELNLPTEVPYGVICSCNPSNGGSGICGCIMGNKMVPNPKLNSTNSMSNSTNSTSNFMINYLYSQK